MKILSKRNLLQVHRNCFPGSSLQSITALPTHQNLFPLDKHVWASPGHVFVFSQIAFWWAEQNIVWVFWHRNDFAHTISIPLGWGSTALVQQHKLTSHQFALAAGELLCLFLYTNPAESTDKVLSKSEEIKWGQKWIFSFHLQNKHKTHQKANVNLVKLQRYSMHTHSLHFPLFILLLSQKQLSWQALEVEILESSTHLAHLDESPEHKNFCFHAIPSKRNQSKDLTAILCLKYWLQSNGTAQCGWAWHYSCLKTKSLYIKKKFTRDRIYPERIISNRNEDEEENMHTCVFRERGGEGERGWSNDTV